MELQEPVLVQGIAFVVAALTGVAVGMVTDAYRALAQALRPPRPARHALDVLFVVVLTPIVAAGLLASNWGALRVYPLAALALGFGLYLALGSPLVLPFLCWLAAGVVGALTGLGRLAAWPVKRLRAAAARVIRATRQRRGGPRGGGTEDPAPPIPGSE